MDNVDIYATANVLAEQHPEHELSIAYIELSPAMTFTDNPERLATAKALIAMFE